MTRQMLVEQNVKVASIAYKPVATTSTSIVATRTTIYEAGGSAWRSVAAT